MPLTRSVSEIMTREVVTLNEEDNLDGVGQAMDLLKFRCFPVVDGDRLVGLLSHRNLLRVTGAGLLASVPGRPEPSVDQQTFVGAVMDGDPARVREDTSVVDAARMFVDDQQIVALPVVGDEDLLVGIITRHDLLRYMLELLSQHDG